MEDDEPPQPKQTPAIVERFMQTYSPSHFQHIASRAHDLITSTLTMHQRTVFRGEALDCRVVFRAKSHQSLLEKLIRRYSDKHYATPDDIWADVHDLAGVRIILNTPSKDQHEKVKKAMEAIWGKDVTVKLHGISSTSSVHAVFPSLGNDAPKSTHESMQKGRKKGNGYVPKQLGYQGVHYRVAMRPEHACQKYKWTPNDRVEIQVLSALGHVWAEAGHDIQYKASAYGPPSAEEERILQAVGGLISSGDLLLEQYGDLVHERTYAKMENLDRFRTVLLNMDIVLEVQETGRKRDGDGTNSSSNDDFAPEGVDMMFRFLVSTGKNSPLALRKALQGIGYPDTTKERFREILASFNPHIEPPEGLLTPLCLMRHAMSEARWCKEEKPRADYSRSEKCRKMMEALLLLQTFADCPEAAKRSLSHSIDMTEQERDSINAMLSSERRLECLTGEDAHISDIFSLKMAPAWSWFQAQAALPESMCGFFFRLAELGVAKALEVRVLLERLSIGELSETRRLRSNL
ncbi:hypothetical protein EJ02DRAFT_423351 [Clathrospora elynae]|uniref:RelA/SpoT domain-containing protein n=1 Tax=Clathrospora elynae TaxID=706981 RepID=A0A6A5SKI6_9PLEO|nr:hypothetical protein EJ02DRAFT_423351 [Clathrospora elynae]